MPSAFVVSLLGFVSQPSSRGSSASHVYLVCPVKQCNWPLGSAARPTTATRQNTIRNYGSANDLVRPTVRLATRSITETTKLCSINLQLNYRLRLVYKNLLKNRCYKRPQWYTKKVSRRYFRWRFEKTYKYQKVQLSLGVSSAID